MTFSSISGTGIVRTLMTVFEPDINFSGKTGKIMKKIIFFVSVFLIFCFISFSVSAGTIQTISFGELPQGAKDVIYKIRSGSTDWPFVKNDGRRFGNREKLLPQNNNSLYKEYTVCTDKMARQLKKGKHPNRGKERIVHDVKNDIYYYTGDHYKTFRRVIFKNG